MIVAQVGVVGAGAGTAALKIARGLRKAEIETWYFAADPRGASRDEAVTELPRQLASWNSPRALVYRAALRAYTVRRPHGSGLFSYTSLPLDSPFPFDIVRPDIIHLNWIAQGIDYRSFFSSIPPTLPVVWTLQDMEPFTGGCHYAGPCRRYEERCGRCPQLNALRNPFDLSAITHRRKRRLLAPLNLTVVGLSRAIAAAARQSPVFAHARDFHVIPTSIDTSIFSPRDRAGAREMLRLPLDRVIVSFAAVDMLNPYKGLSVLLDALARLRNRDRVFLLLMGGSLPETVAVPVPHRHAGFIADRHAIAELFSAADVHVIPSSAEALGQVGMEALACGTPVVGSRVGGIPDYVLDGRTGLLFDADRAEDLAAKLDRMIDHPTERRSMGAAGPRLVRNLFSPERVIGEYMALYGRAMRGS